MSFGEFITIERQLTDRDYYCRYGITGEIFPVHVQPEFADEVADDFLEPNPADPGFVRKGCVFMKENPGGKGFACAIYPTRPTVCREFRCYRMLIHHPASGETRGKVIGVNELRTQDENLMTIWNTRIAGIPHPSKGQRSSADHTLPGDHSIHGQDYHLKAHINNVTHAEDKEWVSAVISILAEHGYLADPVE